MTSRAAIALAALAILAAPPLRAQPADWCRIDDPAIARTQPCPAIDDHPQSLPVQLALPLPCGGYLLLRKVVVPSATVLDEQTVYLGGAAADSTASGLESVTNGPVQLPLAGGFFAGEAPRAQLAPTSLEKLNGRAYYIAKYPLTEPQRRRIDLLGADPTQSPTPSSCQDYAAFVAGPLARDIRPATNMSWFQALDILRRYQDWLLAQDRTLIRARRAPQLPWEQGSPSYLRLPTEAEWEFAARGGVADKQDQSQRSYRIRDPQSGNIRVADVDEIAPLQDVGADTGGPPAARLGRKLPNLLDLYDLVGNVEQMVLEPFRLTRPDQLHGQAGGYIVKGGKVLDSAQIVGVGHRREVPYFDLDGETRSPLVGFRPVLSVPVQVGGLPPGVAPFTPDLQNPALDAALLAARAALVSSPDPSQAAIGDDLADLSKANDTGALDRDQLRGQLKAIQFDLDRSNARLAVADRENQKQKFEGAVLLAFSLQKIGKNDLDALMFRSDLRRKIAASPLTLADRQHLDRELASHQAQIDEAETAMEASFGYYVGVISDLAKLPDKSRATAAGDVLDDFSGQHIDNIYRHFQDLVRKHTDDLVKARMIVTDSLRRRWLGEIDVTRADRMRLEHQAN